MKPDSLRRGSATLGLAIACIATLTAPTRAADPTPAAASKKPAAETPPAAPSNTTFAQRTVRVTWDKSSGLSAPDVQGVFAKLQRAGVVGPIGRDVLGLTPERSMALVGWREPRIAGDGIEFDFAIDLSPEQWRDARPAAKEFADRLVASFTQLLADDRQEQEGPKMQQAKQWLADLTYEYESTVQRMRKQQAEMGGQLPEGARAALAKLEDERQRIELDLAGMEARQKAVEEWIARTSKEMQEQAKTDPVVQELEKAVAAQQKVVDVSRRQFESGTLGIREVSDAESKLSDIKVQLLDRKRGGAGGNGTGTDPLAALNRELQSLSIDVIDRKARLAFVDKRVDALQKAARSASDYELLESERTSLRRELEQARQEFRAARRAAQLSPRDRVVVVRSNDGRHEKPADSDKQ